MDLNGVVIEDSYAEAFSMWCSRLLVTAENERWVKIAAQVVTGFGTSIISWPVEAGIDRYVSPDETPDGRPGAYIIFFGRDKKSLPVELLRRIGQCLLPCPTTAVFDALENPKMKFDIGGKLKFFGDGYHRRLRLDPERPVYRIPCMEGEFVVEQFFGGAKGVAGGNFLIQGRTLDAALKAAEAAVDAIKDVDLVMTPFPGGVCRSGSKVGSKYAFLRASTNTAFCPTLRSLIPETAVMDGVNSVYEIIIDGVTLDKVKEATRVGIEAAVQVDGIIGISAGNYGGKLGKYLIYFKELFC